MIDGILTNSMNDLLTRGRASTGIPTGPKIYSELCGSPPWSADRRIPERTHMPTQKRETGKNYIGLLSEEIDEQCLAEVQSVTDRRMQEYVRGMMATILSRRNEAR
jgi:hypothetical protein